MVDSRRWFSDETLTYSRRVSEHNVSCLGDPHGEGVWDVSVRGERRWARTGQEFATSAAEEIYRLAPPALKHQEIRRVSL
jgi:hypothetical protein